MGTQGSPVKSYDYLLKFLLVGDSDVGKGEILASLQDGAAESPYGHPAGECGVGAREERGSRRTCLCLDPAVATPAAPAAMPFRTWGPGRLVGGLGLARRRVL